MRCCSLDELLGVRVLHHLGEHLAQAALLLVRLSRLRTPAAVVAGAGASTLVSASWRAWSWAGQLFGLAHQLMALLIGALLGGLQSLELLRLLPPTRPGGQPTWVCWAADLRDCTTQTTAQRDRRHRQEQNNDVLHKSLQRGTGQVPARRSCRPRSRQGRPTARPAGRAMPAQPGCQVKCLVIASN